MEKAVEQTWMRRHLQALNLTTLQAAKQCGISLETMQVVVSGRPTLPTLALRIGKGLKLTQEQVKPLGKSLDANAWGKNGLPVPDAVDVDPLWWKQLPKWRKIKAEETTELPIGCWLDIRAVFERLIVLDRGVETLRPLLRNNTLNGINALQPKSRAAWIRMLEAELGARTSSFATSKRPKGMHNIGFLPSYERITKLMQLPRNTPEAIAQRLYPSKSGLVTLEYNLGRIEQGEWFSIDKAQRWADALGVKLSEIGEKKVRVY